MFFLCIAIYRQKYNLSSIYFQTSKHNYTLEYKVTAHVYTLYYATHKITIYKTLMITHD